MSTNNPVLKRFNNLSRQANAFSTQQQSAPTYPTQTWDTAGQQNYVQPPTPVSNRFVTLPDVINKTMVMFAIILGVGAISWFAHSFILLMVGFVGGLVLGLVNSFKREPSRTLILLYAACEGALLGSLSYLMELAYPGIVLQAVLGTLAVFGVTLLLFRNAHIRATSGMKKFFLIAISGYLVFSLMNIGLQVFGVVKDPYGLLTSVTVLGIPLGILTGLFAVVLCSISLIIDFTSIEDGIQRNLPEKMSWYFAFALTVTIVWLYLEILRILAILRR